MANLRTPKVELEELSATEGAFYESILDPFPEKFRILSSEEAAQKMQASAALYEEIKKERAQRELAFAQAIEQATPQKKSPKRTKKRRGGGASPKKSHAVAAQ